MHAGLRDAPPTPPSVSRKLESDHKQSTGCQQFKEFLLTTLKAFKNIYFLMYMTVAGKLPCKGILHANYLPRLLFQVNSACYAKEH